VTDVLASSVSHLRTTLVCIARKASCDQPRNDPPDGYAHTRTNPQRVDASPTRQYRCDSDTEADAPEASRCEKQCLSSPSSDHRADDGHREHTKRYHRKPN
jgi:hypothetical protein